MKITFPDSKRVDAEYNGFVHRIDQHLENPSGFSIVATVL